MKIQDAIAIAENCARAARIAGLLADVPYSQAQLCTVIAALNEHAKELKSDLTLANRRYAAANAQMQRLAKKYNVKVEVEDVNA